MISSRTLARSVNNTLVVKQYGSGYEERYFPYVEVREEKFFDRTNSMHAIHPGDPATPPITTRTETSYDDYGNPTYIVREQLQGETPSGAVHKSITARQYLNDTNQWLLGRLTGATVIKTDPEGNSVTRDTAFEYDAVTGLLTAEIAEPGDPDLMKRTDYVYDSFGNKTEIAVSGADIQTRTTTMTWNSRGQFKSATTNVLGQTESYSYNDKHGGRISRSGPNGLTTTWEYDPFGRETKRTAPDGTTVSTSYGNCDSLCPSPVPFGILSVHTISSDGSEGLAAFDYRGRQLLESKRNYSDDWIHLVTRYDRRDRVIAKNVPHRSGPGNDFHWTYYYHDAQDRVTKIESPTNAGTSGGVVTQITRDGLVSHTTDPNGNVTEKHRDAAGRVVKIVDAEGGVTEFEYGPYGNKTKVIDDDGNVTTMTYDKLGRKVAMDDPDMGQWTYEYDVLDNLVSQTDAKGQTVTFQYDKLGRRVQRTEPEGAATWEYDTGWVGKIHKETAPNGFQRDYVYDGLGRPTDVTTTIEGDSYTVSRTYDSESRVKKLTYPSGFAVRHNYTATGYLEEIVDDDTDEAYWQLGHRDAFGNVEEAILGNGHSTLRNYDNARGHVDAIMTGDVMGTEVQSLSYTWDKAGNLTERVDQNQGGLTETFTYDALNRVTGSTLDGNTNLNVAYDALGNITQKSGVGSYTYGANGAGPHAVTAVTGDRPATYSYDANGNMLQGNGRSLTWTSFNKPATITQGQGYSEFYYGPDRQRTEQLRERDEGGQLVTTTIHYVGALYEKHEEGFGFEQRHHIRVDGQTVAVKIHYSDATEATQYLHRDALGSVTAVTNAAGNIVEKYSYDAFGKRRETTWLADPDDSLLYSTIQELERGYTGHEHLDHVGLVHMNGRVQDPIIGRFASADPLIPDPQSSQSYNRYSYVQNNPLRYTDPSGFQVVDPFLNYADFPTWYTYDLYMEYGISGRIIASGPLVPAGVGINALEPIQVNASAPVSYRAFAPQLAISHMNMMSSPMWYVGGGVMPDQQYIPNSGVFSDKYSGIGGLVKYKEYQKKSANGKISGNQKYSNGESTSVFYRANNTDKEVGNTVSSYKSLLRSFIRGMNVAGGAAQIGAGGNYIGAGLALCVSAAGCVIGGPSILLGAGLGLLGLNNIQEGVTGNSGFARQMVGDTAVDAANLFGSGAGLVRPLLRSNDFGSPAFKLFNRIGSDYTPYLNRATNSGLSAELLLGGSGLLGGEYAD